jgi:hypothetical protein
MLNVCYHEEQDWVEPYFKYHSDEEFNYFVWVGGETMGVFRFLRVPLNGAKWGKHHIGEHYIISENFSNVPFIDLL